MYVLSTIMDFSKAFDKVQHDCLLYKLDRTGMDPQTSAWVKSFLFLRMQKVVISGKESDTAPVTSGVPQGLGPGPILFLVCIDDMSKYTQHSQIKLFTGDTIVFLASLRSVPPTSSYSHRKDVEVGCTLGHRQIQQYVSSISDLE